MSDALRWFPIPRPSTLRFDPGAAITVAGVELAIFPLGEGYVALANSCPHAGGPLADGYRDGNRIECPWHGWSFDLETGACQQVPKRPARSIPLRERDGQYEVALPLP